MRTTLLDQDGNPRYTNRLANESSPYLVQHAHNPVDWYPWGKEAFELARQEDKPVFLSIGYSTCHWCHVMEHESFDDEEIAGYLNEHFISIKLDREQRPDLDDVYMTGVQMMTGQGGWPMSNFLTADGKPFYAGTYFPPRNFLALLQQIHDVWHERRDDVMKQADEIATGIGQYTSARSEAKALADNLAARASAELLDRFDEENGGFGGAPKFPNESSLAILMEDWQRNGNQQALDALTLTLDKMYMGGIHDQVAGGFHRYTVDAIWLVPHFEKMLYNQAQLVRVYAVAAATADSWRWRRVVAKLVEYLQREMTNGEGAFYSATDADSEGEEGLFFVWTPDQLAAVLPQDDVEFVTELYGVTAAGNFEGSNILKLVEPWADDAEVLARIDRIHTALLAAREQREHPLRDEKIITAWNGMMITGLAQADLHLPGHGYIDVAARAAETVWQTAFDDGQLWRIIYQGERSIPGNLEDYAFLAEAMLTLFEATTEPHWLERGQLLVAQMIARFWDDSEGAFFLALPEDEGPMITRPKSPMDGATPSANSAALHALVMLFEATGDVALSERISATINAFAGLLQTSPSAFTYLIAGAERFAKGPAGPARFLADGNIHVRYLPRGDRAHRIEVTLAKGWHINASTLTDPDLIPTAVEAGGAEVVYPVATRERYEGKIEFDIVGDVTEISLTLQPCNDTLCMAAETVKFSALETSGRG